MNSVESASVELIKEAHAAALRRYHGSWSVRVARVLAVLGAFAFLASGRLAVLPHPPIVLALWGFGLSEVGAILVIPAASYWLIRRLGVTRRRIARQLRAEMAHSRAQIEEGVVSISPVANGQPEVLG